MTSAFYPTSSSFDSSVFDGSTLIVPSVSLANLPQLAVDILITSLQLRLVGFLGPGETVVPFFGPGDNDELVTGGIEVYGNTEGSLYVLQQRSPSLKSQKDAHVELLRSFISAHSFDFVLILTSMSASNQDDAQLLTPHQHILPPHLSSEAESSKSHQLKALSALPPLYTHTSPSTIYPPFLPAGGLTRRLLKSLNTPTASQEDSPSKAPTTNHGTIVAWCAEGDNRADAADLANVVLAVLGQQDVEVKEPESWRGLFGTREGWSGGLGNDAELYG